MKALLPFIFTCHLLLEGVFCLGQNKQLEFNLVEPPSGMHPGTLAGVQDVHGYMWIGSYQSALRRYDGYNYIFYTNNPSNSNSLGGNWIQSICASLTGDLWIGTKQNGLDRFNPATGQFKHYRFDPVNVNSISNDDIRSIVEDKEGLIWIGTAAGLNRIDPNSGNITRFYHDPHDPQSLSCNQVVKVYEDRAGTIWVGTGSVWHDEGGKTDEGGLNRLDKNSGKFTRFLNESNNPESLINNKVKAIFEDSRGIFWIGTAGDGLHTMDRTKGSFVRHPFDPANPEKISRPAQKKIRTWADDHITFIIEDAAGAVWIGTFGNGLNRFDPKTNKVTHFPLFKDPDSGLLLEVPWWASNSRDGILWIGFFRGLYRIDPLRKNIPYYSTGTTVDEIYEDSSGMLWYGTDEGLVRKNRRTEVEQRFVHDPNNPNSISNNRVHAILEDRHGALWIGTESSLDRFDRRKELFVIKDFTKNFDSVIGYDGVHSIYEDQGGIFWLGTRSGLIQMNREADIVKYYHHIPEDSTSLSKGEVILIYEDNSENIWAFTFGGSLNKLSRKTEKFERFFSAQNIHNLWQDSDGILWVGTSKGLYHSNAELNKFKRFIGPNSEFSEDLIVNAIIEDDEQNLWVSASVGICRLNPERNKVLIFSRYGDPAWYNGTGKFKGKSGELFFGGGGGYFTFFPDQITVNNEPPTIVFNEFHLADQAIGPEKDGPLKEPLSQVEQINLIHNQDNFSIGFAGIHYSNPKQNPHLYILEGLDNSWRKAGEEKTAYYYNVPAGSYTFRVRAANSDGVWAEKNISIVILPPWWHTWWAYIVYGGVGIAFIYGFRVYTINREKIKHELKIQKMEAEKMHEIDHLKSRFFANISHEFRTPLTLIQSPLEELLNHPAYAKEHSLFKMMQRNAQRLLHLINQLLDLSKLEAGSMNLEVKTADLISFLKAVVLSFTSLAERRHIQYQFKYPPERPVLYYDSDMLEKIITNLLSNAFKFTPDGGEITITACLIPAEKKDLPADFKKTGTSSKVRMLELKVQDNGIGIPKELIEKIFDRFFQKDISRTRKYEGTGIGLSLVKELVELHQGKISVESQLGKGSCFTTLLPLLVADIEEMTSEHPSITADKSIVLSHTDDTEFIGSSKVIISETDTLIPLVLIVEDNADIRAYIRQHLYTFYQIVEATDGEEGFTAANNLIPDLILSDVMMPVMDGVEMCRKLKENEKTAHIPVILLTAKASRGDKIEGWEAGADDYIFKPFEASEIMLRIKNMIDSRNKLREHYSRQVFLEPASISITSLDELFLQRVMKIIEDHMADPYFSVEILAIEAGMSRTQLHRKLKALTNESPGELIKIIRLKRAAELLSKGAGTIAEVTYKVGFQEPSYFTKCFHKQYGKTPSEFIATVSIHSK